MNDVQHTFATATHCQCGACFCSTAKLSAIDGRAVCGNCKPLYDQMVNVQRSKLMQQ